MTLVTTDALGRELGRPGLILFDATWFGTLPGTGGANPAELFEAGHIPGARFLDLAHLSDGGGKRDGLPTADHVRWHLEALGVTDTTDLVLYDQSPLKTAARAWWLLRSFGVTRVALLDGGLARWRAEGRPLATGMAPVLERGWVSAEEDRSRARDRAAMLANLESGAEQVLDARSPSRFAGTEIDPRGLPSGHIPGSLNLPYGQLFNPDGTWKRGPALEAAFAASGVDLDRPIVTTCGSGVTAAVLAFGLHLLGRDAALYDGSWTDWASDPHTPKATETL